jgi:hypothetical protein
MPSLTVIYDLGLLPAIPAGVALAMHASNKDGGQSRAVNVACCVIAALLWPVTVPLFIVGLVLDLLRCGWLIDRFLGWVVAAIERKWGGDV